MRFTSLNIKSFRGFTNFEMTALKRVNLLMGRNNSGKTTVLEALFMLTNPTNPGLLFKLLDFRSGQSGLPTRLLSSFHNQDISASFSLSAGTTENGIDDDRSMVCTASNPPVYAESAGSEFPSRASSGSGVQLEFTRMSYAVTSRRNGSTDLNIDYNQADNSWKSGSVPNDAVASAIKSYFLTGETFLHGLGGRLDAAIQTRQVPPIVEALKALDPKIEDIQSSDQNVYVYTGVTPMYPITVMGDGVKNMLSILATVICIKGGVVLIDEIDTGFHHSALPALWKAILAATRKNDVQIIAATHSAECAHALAGAASGPPAPDEDVAFFRIRRDEGGGHASVPLSVQNILTAAEMEVEVRG